MRDRVLRGAVSRATGGTAIYCERYQQDGCRYDRETRKPASNSYRDRNRRAPNALHGLIGAGDTRDAAAGGNSLGAQEAAAREIARTPTSVNQILKAEAIRRHGYAVSVQEDIFVHCRYRRALCLGTKMSSAVSRSSGYRRIKATGIERLAEPFEASLVIYRRLMVMEKSCVKKVCCDDCKR